MREDLPDAGIQAEDAGGAVELLEHRAKDAAVLGHVWIIVGRLELRGMPTATTVSGRHVAALYTPDDIAALDYERDLGSPGEFPYTRGIHASGYRGKLWTMRQFAGFGTPEDTNARYKQRSEERRVGKE